MRNQILSMIISLIVFIVQNTAYSQTNNFNFRIAPLSLLDIYNGSCYKIGIELKIVSNNSLILEGGGYFRNFNDLKNIQGHIVDFGIRHYFTKEMDNRGRHLSLNYSYKEQAFDYRDTILAANPYFKEL